jgi:hypothetical protein
MSGGIGDQAAAIAKKITDDTDAFATVDPGEAASNRPCILVGPPRLDWRSAPMGGPLVTWTLVALASKPTGSVEALNELDALMEAVVDLLPIETAAPARYPVGTEQVPAYLLTLNA